VRRRRGLEEDEARPTPHGGGQSLGIVVFERDARVAEVVKRNIIERVSGWVRATPEFVRQVEAEGRKIVWPGRKETVNTTIMVIAMTLLLGFFFFGTDTVFQRIVKFLLSLAA
jgi:preprotein translocase subunit SecE